MIKTTLARAGLALVAFSAYAVEAAAMGNSRVVQAPEIDGPAGMAAVALLVSAGVMAYQRLRK